MKFNERGEELPDPTPVEVPAGFKEPESLQSMIARLVRTHVSAAAERHGFETVDEANDFEVPDEEFPETKYEVLGDEQLEERHRAIVDTRAAKLALAKRAARGAWRNGPSARGAQSTKQPDSQDVQHRPETGSGGLRGSSGGGHIRPSGGAAGGSGQTAEGRED